MKKKSFLIALCALLLVVGVLGFLGSNMAAAQNTVFVPDVPMIPNRSLPEIISEVLIYVLGFLGFLAVIIILVGGFQWMTAAGDDSKVGTAKKTLSAGIIGLLIILGSWAIASFVFSIFGIGTTPGSPPGVGGGSTFCIEDTQKGASSQPCCAGDICNSYELVCAADGLCHHCGNINERCCGGTTCNDGNDCNTLVTPDPLCQ